MASITRWGTCVPPGPSRKAAGLPLTVCASDGNCERTQVRSSEVEEACSAIGIGADIVNGLRPSGTSHGFRVTLSGRQEGEPRLTKCVRAVQFPLNRIDLGTCHHEGGTYGS